MRGVGGPLLTIGDLLSDLAVEGGDGPLVGVGDASAPSSLAASQQGEKADPFDLSRLFEVVGEMQSSLDRVRRQLFSTSTRHLLQGPLLKRSDTLRKWNERWVILDPTTGKIEYKVRRSDKDVRGVILFDSISTVTLSPMNFQYGPTFQFVMTSGCTLWKLCNDLCKLLVQWTGKIRWMLFLYWKSTEKGILSLCRNSQRCKSMGIHFTVRKEKLGDQKCSSNRKAVKKLVS